MTTRAISFSHNSRTNYMKRLLLALIFWTQPVLADDVARAENGVGGYIILTNDHSLECQGATHDMRATKAGEPDDTGCWTYDEKNIYIRWSDGEYATYPLGTFHPIRETNT